MLLTFRGGDRPAGDLAVFFPPFRVFFDPAFPALGGVALFLRFAVGAVVWANDLVEYFFLEEQRTQATITLVETKDSLTDLSSDVQKDKQNQSWWDGMKDSLSGLTSDHEQRIKEQTEKASSSIVDLIVVYIAQTILFPILFLFAMLMLLIS